MSSRGVSVAGYVLIATVAGLIQLVAWSGRTRVPPLGTLLSAVMRSRPVRVGIMTGWAWLGLHFFVR